MIEISHEGFDAQLMNIVTALERQDPLDVMVKLALMTAYAMRVTKALEEMEDGASKDLAKDALGTVISLSNAHHKLWCEAVEKLDPDN